MEEEIVTEVVTEITGKVGAEHQLPEVQREEDEEESKGIGDR